MRNESSPQDKRRFQQKIRDLTFELTTRGATEAEVQSARTALQLQEAAANQEVTELSLYQQALQEATQLAIQDGFIEAPED